MIRACAALCVAAVAAHAAVGQEIRVSAGAGPVYARSAGSLAAYVSDAYGLGGVVTWRLARSPVAVRLDADYVSFAQTTRSRPYVGSQLLIATGSRIFATGAGPQLRIALGPVVLFGSGAAGFAYLINTGAVAGVDSARFNRATSFNNLTYALSAGGGVALRVAGGPAPVWLDASARYVTTGPAEWVREGNLPAGVISGAYLNPTWARAAFALYRLSVTVGVSR